MLHILADLLFQNNGRQANANKKDFIKSASDKSLELPEACFINYDPVAIERQDTSCDDQYLLRSVNKLGQGQYE